MRNRRGVAGSPDLRTVTNRAVVVAFLQAVQDGSRRATSSQLRTIAGSLGPRTSRPASSWTRSEDWGNLPPRYRRDHSHDREIFDRIYAEIDALGSPDGAREFYRFLELAEATVRRRRRLGVEDPADARRDDLGLLTSSLTAGELLWGQAPPTLAAALAAARSLTSEETEHAQTPMELDAEGEAITCAAGAFTSIARYVVGYRVHTWLKGMPWGTDPSSHPAALQSFDDSMSVREDNGLRNAFFTHRSARPACAHFGLPDPEVHLSLNEVRAMGAISREQEEERWWVGTIAYLDEGSARAAAERNGSAVERGTQSGPGDWVSDFTQRLENMLEYDAQRSMQERRQNATERDMSKE
jgi:hypothetical protein